MSSNSRFPQIITSLLVLVTLSTFSLSTLAATTVSSHPATTQARPLPGKQISKILTPVAVLELQAVHPKRKSCDAVAAMLPVQSITNKKSKMPATLFYPHTAKNPLGEGAGYVTRDSMVIGANHCSYFSFVTN